MRFSCESVQNENFDDSLKEIAHKIASQSKPLSKLAKQAVNVAYETTLEEGIRSERAYSIQLLRLMITLKVWRHFQKNASQSGKINNQKINPSFLALVLQHYVIAIHVMYISVTPDERLDVKYKAAFPTSFS